MLFDLIQMRNGNILTYNDEKEENRWWYKAFSWNHTNLYFIKKIWYLQSRDEQNFSSYQSPKNITSSSIINFHFSFFQRKSQDMQ